MEQRAKLRACRGIIFGLKRETVFLIRSGNAAGPHKLQGLLHFGQSINPTRHFGSTAQIRRLADILQQRQVKQLVSPLDEWNFSPERTRGSPQGRDSICNSTSPGSYYTASEILRLIMVEEIRANVAGGVETRTRCF
jgi:hypothetical protein